MDIKEKAVQQAIKMLEAVGAQYEIVTEDGKRYGEIVRRTRSKEPSIFMPFKDTVAALNPGESMFLDCAKDKRDDMQRAVASFMAYKFGAGNYMTSRCQEGIEVLVLADKNAPRQDESQPASNGISLPSFLPPQH